MITEKISRQVERTEETTIGRGNNSGEGKNSQSLSDDYLPLRNRCPTSFDLTV